MSFKESQLGSIKFLETSSTTDEVGIVLFHGYGASCEDLAPLSNLPIFPKQATWIFPDGLIEVPVGLGVPGKAWFPLDMELLNEAMLKQTWVDFSTESPKGFSEASNKVSEFLESLSKRFKCLFVGGFSQGAMVSSDAVLALSWNPTGLIQFSGNLISKIGWEEKIAKKEPLDVFISHGKQDPVLGFKGAENLNSFFLSHHFHTEFVPFSGGHELPPLVLEKCSKFIAARVL